MNEVYPKVKFLNWLKQLFGYEFPEPKHHNLSPQAFFDFYHKKVNSRYKGECKILVYRTDPAKAPWKSFVKMAALPSEIRFLEKFIENEMMPDLEWWEHSTMEHPWMAVFCVRLQRTWKTEHGSRTREICISTFEVFQSTPDGGRQAT